MKGFKDPQGKFRPTENKKGVRMSRDQSAKTQGVRLARTVTSKNLPMVNINRHNWSLETEDGKVRSLSLGNWSDAGWHWSGNETDLNTFLIRINKSQAEKEFLDDMSEHGITFEMLKNQLLKNLSGNITPSNDDGEYSISGDNVRWKFGEPEPYNEGEFDFAVEELGLKESEKDIFDKEYWGNYNSVTYEEFLTSKGETVRQMLRDTVKESDSFEEYFSNLDDVHSEVIEDILSELEHEKVSEATYKTVNDIKAKRDEVGVTR